MWKWCLLSLLQMEIGSEWQPWAREFGTSVWHTWSQVMSSLIRKMISASTLNFLRIILMLITVWAVLVVQHRFWRCFELVLSMSDMGTENRVSAKTLLQPYNYCTETPPRALLQFAVQVESRPKGQKDFKQFLCFLIPWCKRFKNTLITFSYIYPLWSLFWFPYLPGVYAVTVVVSDLTVETGDLVPLG